MMPAGMGARKCPNSGYSANQEASSLVTVNPSLPDNNLDNAGAIHPFTQPIMNVPKHTEHKVGVVDNKTQFEKLKIYDSTC